jgi:transposase
MRPARSPAELGFTGYDRRRLQRALRHVQDARQFRRLLAVKLLAEGKGVGEVSQLTCLSRPIVYRWLRRYLSVRKVTALADLPRRGRPRAAPALTAELLMEEVRRSPREVGYASNGWTVTLLATHLHRKFGIKISEHTLRRRMHAARLRWKRPRHVYATKAPYLPQKKGALFAV